MKVPDDIRGTKVYRIVSKDRRSIMLPTASAFSLHYEAGKITEAINHTFGIFCFRTLVFARTFFDRYHRATAGDMVIRVLGIGTPVYPDIISALTTLDDYILYDFYENRRIGGWLNSRRRYALIRPSTDTICFPQVFVLE